MAKGTASFIAIDTDAFKAVLKGHQLTATGLCAEMGYSRSWMRADTGRIPEPAAVWLEKMHGIKREEYIQSGRAEAAAVSVGAVTVERGVIKALDRDATRKYLESVITAALDKWLDAEGGRLMAMLALALANNGKLAALIEETVAKAVEEQLK